MAFVAIQIRYPEGRSSGRHGGVYWGVFDASNKARRLDGGRANTDAGGIRRVIAQ